jgi:hypothetical protein
MKSVVLFTIALSTLFLTGCPKSKPNVPPVIAQRLANYELKGLQVILKTTIVLLRFYL